MLAQDVSKDNVIPLPGLLPEVSEAPADELLRIAPLLAAADAAIDEIGREVRALEQAALDNLQALHADQYSRLDAAKAERERLSQKARDLLELHRQATGANGRILNGYYTLMRSEQKVLGPKISDGHLLAWLILNALHLLRRVVKIDYDALRDLIAPDGKLLPAFMGMPVAITTLIQEGTRIEWEHLPRPETAAPTGTDEAEANARQEQAGEPSPARFPSH